MIEIVIVVADNYGILNNKAAVSIAGPHLLPRLQIQCDDLEDLNQCHFPLEPNIKISSKVSIHE